MSQLRGPAIGLLSLALAFAIGFAVDHFTSGRSGAAVSSLAAAKAADRDDDDDKKGKDAPAKTDAKGGGDDDDDAKTLTLDPTAQQRAGIVAHTVPVRSVAPTRRAVASVVDLQPLIELADSLAAAKTQVAAAQARRDAARAAYERAQLSFSRAGSTSAAQVEAAEANSKAEQAAVDAADSHASALGASASRAWGPVLGRALVDGGAAVARLLDRRDTLLQVSLPQGDLLAGQAPRKATLEIAKGDAGRVPLTFVSWAPKADPRLPGASLLFATPSRDALVPGATWPVDLPVQGEVTGGIVPASAVVWSDGHAWYFERSGEKRFEQHPLGNDAVPTEGGFVVPAVDDDDEIVVQGAQALLSEQQRSSIDLDETGGR